MVALLPIDISDYVLEVRLADGERSISGLPMEAAKFGALGFDPLRRARLQFLHDLGQRPDARQIEKCMDVIGGPVFWC
jgi:hypothetical protein